MEQKYNGNNDQDFSVYFLMHLRMLSEINIEISETSIKYKENLTTTCK